jgi:hypothetical protein
MEYVGKLIKKITYADTSAVTVGALPPNCVIDSVNVAVITAFNAGGNDYLDIGTASAAAAIVNDHSLASKGSAAVTIASTVHDAFSASNSTIIKAVYVPAGSAATEGEADITINFHQL